MAATGLAVTINKRAKSVMNLRASYQTIIKANRDDNAEFEVARLLTKSLQEKVSLANDAVTRANDELDSATAEHADAEEEMDRLFVQRGGNRITGELAFAFVVEANENMGFNDELGTLYTKDNKEMVFRKIPVLIEHIVKLCGDNAKYDYAAWFVENDRVPDLLFNLLEFPKYATLAASALGDISRTHATWASFPNIEVVCAALGGLDNDGKAHISRLVNNLCRKSSNDNSCWNCDDLVRVFGALTTNLLIDHSFCQRESAFALNQVLLVVSSSVHSTLCVELAANIRVAKIAFSKLRAPFEQTSPFVELIENMVMGGRSMECLAMLSLWVPSAPDKSYTDAKLEEILTSARARMGSDIGELLETATTKHDSFVLASAKKLELERTSRALADTGGDVSIRLPQSGEIIRACAELLTVNSSYYRGLISRHGAAVVVDADPDFADFAHRELLRQLRTLGTVDISTDGTFADMLSLLLLANKIKGDGDMVCSIGDRCDKFLATGCLDVDSCAAILRNSAALRGCAVLTAAELYGATFLRSELRAHEFWPNYEAENPKLPLVILCKDRKRKLSQE